MVKITLLLTYLLCTRFCAAQTSASVSLDVKNEPLIKVMAIIQKQTGYAFISTKENLKSAKPITVQLQDVKLEAALNRVFANQPFSYKISGQIISIVKLQPNDSPDRRIQGDKRATQLTLTGLVSDTTGLALPGVSVSVRGNVSGTITNESGRYSLSNVPEDAVIKFSMIGYIAQEVSFSSKSEINVILKEDHLRLAEISIVSTGYQELPKERATGSFSFLDNKILNRSVSTNFVERLNGVAPGLLFDQTSDNDLGFTIRGRSTILAQTKPLIVLDNFPYEGDLSNINPNDIESISILRDAAATSIWGALAGNGVIVITTKSGKPSQKIKVEFNSNLTVSEKPDQKYNKQFLNPSDYIGVEKMLFENGFYNAAINDTRNYPSLSPAVEVLLKGRSGEFDEDAVTNQLNSLSRHDVRDDLQKYFYRNGVNQQYSLSLRGGAEKLSYMVSSGFDKNLLQETRNDIRRTTLNSNFKLIPFSKFEITTGINIVSHTTRNNSNVNSLTGAGVLDPYTQLADDNGNPMPFNRNYNDRFVEQSNQNGFLDWNYRPLEELRQNNSVTRALDTRLSTGIKYTFLDGLSADVKYQYQRFNQQTRNLIDPESYTVRNLVNRFSEFSEGQITNRNIPNGAILDLGSNEQVYQTIRGQANFNRQLRFGRIDLLGGFEIRDIQSAGNTSRFYGYNDETGTSQPVNLSELLPVNPSGGTTYIENRANITGTIDRYRSLFANAGYSIKDRYTVSASLRFDQSNLFGVETNQKGVPLWSIGAKWDVSSEKFYRWAWLPALALRGSYGYSGNVNKTISAYTISQYQYSSTVPSYTFAWIVSPGNPDLRWEKIGILNMAADFELSSILSGSLDVYFKKGTDMIGTSPVAGSSGFGSLVGNFADIKGKGFDLTLTSQNLKKRSLQWTSDLIVSRSTDVVTKYKGGTTSAIGVEVVEGKPFHSLFATQWAGLDEQGDPQGYLNGEVSKNYSAINNLPKTDRLFYRRQPAFFGSLRNSFTIYRFNLSAMLTWKGGYYFRRSNLNYTNLFNSGIGHADFEKRWQAPGDEARTSVPAMVYPNNESRNSFYGGSEVHISKGDHVRLKDISASYNLTPRNAENRLRLEIYAYANNIGLIWKSDKHGVDPDYSTGFPNPRSLSIGLKATL